MRICKRAQLSRIPRVFYYGGRFDLWNIKYCIHRTSKGGLVHVVDARQVFLSTCIVANGAAPRDERGSDPCSMLFCR